MKFNPIKIKNLIDISHFQEKVPKDRGRITHHTKSKLTTVEKDDFVPGCLSRYNYPKYQNLLFYIKNIVEDILNEKIYPTYHFDRFYFTGQDLKKHVDRPSCEISVSLTLNHNANYDWPLFFDIDGENHPTFTNIGDAVLYSGTNTPHWRYPLEGNSDTYWHQIFFHYVRCDGPYIQHAFEYKDK